ncbi:hypothetical protein SAMN04487910_4584 [Aquimarina amphilecti]|uniref:Uncharacterized protein n=1 Tax=Aquimarina amphilecti TaxID=1038014 RepID=A0A1H7X0K1_AQUAM|nr:hypothetical protein [Aquimarina amphilecti]SEM26598.1 hypothetical protein SAMN04487910_4584 [Aquimarina amphilecti]
MKKMMNSISGIKTLSKSSQKEIKGGMLGLSDCQRGCHRFYLVDIDGVNCAVPSPSGAVCFGTVQNGQCCI